MYSNSALAAARLEHDLECHSELRVEVCVEKRIDRGVEVSKPLQKGAKSMYSTCSLISMYCARFVG